ncbi:hypothetical protein K0M31_009670 [Melipona bicolor]|uniref:Uncharacterized protein n=1 Tax=Melipona bicolor TaxID=60889 RepID=A0AA40KJF1_9HYME|nr:hypothetical protein K0M31_009670 [Melipona bicolor]
MNHEKEEINYFSDLIYPCLKKRRARYHLVPCHANHNTYIGVETLKGSAFNFKGPVLKTAERLVSSYEKECAFARASRYSWSGKEKPVSKLRRPPASRVSTTSTARFYFYFQKHGGHRRPTLLVPLGPRPLRQTSQHFISRLNEKRYVHVLIQELDFGRHPNMFGILNVTVVGANEEPFHVASTR